MSILLSHDHFNPCQGRRLRPKQRTWSRFAVSTLVRSPINLIPFSFLSTPLHQGVDLLRDHVFIREQDTPVFEPCSEVEFDRLTKREKERSLLYQKRQERALLPHVVMAVLTTIQAASHQEYHNVCEDLDILQNFNQWKSGLKTNEFDRRCGYDADLLEAAISDLEDAIAEEDVEALLQTFECHFSRNIAGVNHPQLYTHSHHGTKTLIDDYMATVIAALSLIKMPVAIGQLPQPELQERVHVLETALEHYGRTALTLSGGATMGMKHIGVIKALLDADLLPHIISGTSAGSIVAAVVCCTPDEELITILDRFTAGDMAVFSDEDASFMTRCFDVLLSICTRGALFDERHLARVMKIWLKDMTFLQAYNLTGRKLCIGISADNGKQPRLLSYLNAPNVLIWSAVCASCAVPMVFSPAIIYEKCATTGEMTVWREPGAASKWIDGSVDADIPKEQLAATFGVKNFIVSQVNPHVRLFTGGEKEFTGKEKIIFDDGQPRNLREASLNYVRSLIIGQTPPGWTAQRPEEWRVTRMIKAILRQEYWGDINILPELRFNELNEVFANPTPDFMHRAVGCGERATWRHLSQIRNSYAIELAMVRTIRELKSYAHFGNQIPQPSKLKQEDLTGRGRIDPPFVKEGSRRRTHSLGRGMKLKQITSDSWRRHLRRRSSSSLNWQAGNDILTPLTKSILLDDLNVEDHAENLEGAF